jgi:hypothetical protein
LLVPLSFFKQWSISYSKQENYMLLWTFRIVTFP